MKTHILTACVCMILTQSCTNKNEFNAQPASPEIQMLAGEDEDKRIRTKIVDFHQHVITEVLVELKCTNDAMAELTDDFGEANFYTQFTGEWHAHISKPGYISRDTSFLVTDSVTNLQIRLVQE